MRPLIYVSSFTTEKKLQMLVPKLVTNLFVEGSLFLLALVVGTPIHLDRHNQQNHT